MGRLSVLEFFDGQEYFIDVLFPLSNLLDFYCLHFILNRMRIALIIVNFAIYFCIYILFL